MNSNILIAKNRLLEGEYTCVLYKDEFICSRERGVKPLMELLQSGKDFSGFFAADKTIGAGAAHLYVLLGVSTVWAKVISEEGKSVLEKNGIEVFFEILVPFIINRKGDGKCPIESAVTGIKNSKDALETIKQTLQKLNN